LAKELRGLGLRISLPFSSQDMLKSERTALTLSSILPEENILWRMPYDMRKIKAAKVVVKNMWLYREVVNGTSKVTGSETHWKAP